MRKRSKGGGDDDDPVARIVGGLIGVVIGTALLWFFFSYGIASLLGTN